MSVDLNDYIVNPPMLTWHELLPMLHNASIYNYDDYFMYSLVSEIIDGLWANTTDYSRIKVIEGCLR